MRAEGRRQKAEGIHHRGTEGTEAGREAQFENRLLKVTPEKDGQYKFVIKNAGGTNTVTFNVKVAK